MLTKLTILTPRPAALHHRSSPSSMRIVRSGFLIALALFGTMLAGCSSLLPRGSDATQVPWKTFEEARAAVEAIEPFRTRKSTLMQNGFDPYHNPAVTILSYPEIIQRFAAGSALQGEEYEHGIRSCLLAGQACSGYSIAVKRIRQNRIGNFWLDILGFLRRTNITGFTFNAMILFVDDQVVYVVYSGQPKMDEMQVRRNPLGPLQSIGDAIRVR
ncbi:MAG: hypothetical protein GX539_06305 [Candidatus Cloacimonetes bacterium]|nr:hypothetical protein [Candidatus Cloacimonadota bacterium]